MQQNQAIPLLAQQNFDSLRNKPGQLAKDTEFALHSQKIRRNNISAGGQETGLGKYIDFLVKKIPAKTKSY